MIRVEAIDALQAALDAEKGARVALEYAIKCQGQMTTVAPCFTQSLREARALVGNAARALLESDVP